MSDSKTQIASEHPVDLEHETFSSSEDEWHAAPAAPVEEGSREAHRMPPDWVMETEEEQELAGEKVPMVFHIPAFNGNEPTTIQATFRMGHDISHVKAYLEYAHHLPFESITLKLKDVICIDPLTIQDLPFVANQENDVTVELN